MELVEAEVSRIDHTEQRSARLHCMVHPSYVYLIYSPLFHVGLLAGGYYIKGGTGGSSGAAGETSPAGYLGGAAGVTGRGTTGGEIHLS